jgi:exopolysaccharide biosynthesis WecB/TagA/CpsF family protein
MSGQVFAPFGLRFDRLGPAAALAFVLRWDRSRPFGYVVTPNVDHLGRLRRGGDLRTAYDDAALCLLDSRVAAGLARVCGAAPPPVVTGADLLAAAMPALAARGARVAVVGLDAAAMDAFAARHPGVDFTHAEPARGFEHDEAALGAVVDFIERARADCTILAVGSPRQEVLAQAVRRRGRAVGIGLCVGAAPLFLSGALRRAPAPLRAAGLEWAWRLMREPARLARRYLIDGPPVLLALAAEFRRPALPQPGSCAIDRSIINGMEAQCSGRLSHDGVPLVPRSAQRRVPDQPGGDASPGGGSARQGG